jgi:hypothetical protein
MRRALIAAALALPVAACGAQSKYEAGEDVRALLLAVRQNDRAAFERYVDRPSLRTSVAAQLNERLAAEAGPYGGLLGGLADQAADQLIRPEAFQIAIRQSGLPDRTPTAAEIAVLLKDAGDGALCLEDARTKECAMTFRKLGEDWKLTAVKVSDVRPAE